MNYLDVLYRAFLEYRNSTANDRECVAQRSTVAKSDVENDSVAITRVICEIDSDWIDAISEGLVSVEKALAQERQFIRADGNIVPIEKVKRVSRDSVEHLSRHSNLITKETPGEDLVPEQLYTVERLNDYAVYENRFLYMLLTYLYDFIGDRYTRILDLTNTYHGKATFHKTIDTRKAQITFDLNLDEKLRDDPIMKEINPCKAELERISMLLKTVNHFLNTPLMSEVGKASKLKPPITKTNVLKMDKDFKGTVALYEYISTYDKDGFTAKMTTKRMMFSEYVADEFAEVYMLTSFLTYEYGMGIKSLLRSHYDEEERRRKLLSEQQKLEQLKRLRRHIAESGESPEGYMLMLEKQIAAYEGIYAKLDAAETEIKRLNDDIIELNTQISSLNDRLNLAYAERDRTEAECRARIDGMTIDHAREIQELHTEWQARLDGLAAEKQSELDALSASFEEKLAAERETHNSRLLALAHDYDEKLEAANGRIAALDKSLADEKTAHRDERDALIATHAREISAMNEVVAQKDKAVLDIREENRLLDDLRRLSDGRLNALRHKYGLMGEADDFTTENAFNELEAQYNAFRKFFKGEWNKTKKKIRAELLSAYRTANAGHADLDPQKDPPAEDLPPDNDDGEGDGDE